MWLRLIAFIAFVSLGLPDGLLGVAWPSMREATGVSLAALGQLLTAGTVGYLLSSVASGSVVVRFGVGRVLTGSTILVISALVLFALTRAWPLLLVAGVLSGLGAGAIDAGVNLFAARAMSTRAMLFLHACYGVGASLGPLVMTAAISSPQGGYGSGYGVVALAMLPLSVVFALTARAWDERGAAPNAGYPAQGATGGDATLIDSARSPAVLLGVLAFGLYAGMEVTAGQWAYSLLTTSRGVDAGVAGLMVSGYWGALTAGRVAFGLAAKSWSANRFVAIGLLLALAGAGLVMLGGLDAARGPAAVWISAAGLVLLGGGFAPVYPLLMSGTPARVGDRLGKHAVGLQVAGAYIGGAAIPGCAGLLGARLGLEVVGPMLAIGTGTVLLIVGTLMGKAKSERPLPPRGTRRE